MEFIKSWKFSVAVLGVLTICAFGLVIYGVASHEEPGFMEVTPGWDTTDFPLAVCATSYNTAGEVITESDLALARSVVATVNERLGFTAYRLGDLNCRVNILLGVPAERGWQDPGGVAEIRHGYCGVSIANVTGELRMLSLYHELGHCLGLAHDEFESSIMRPVQSITPEGHMPPWISDSDRSLIRSTYLGE